MAPSQALCMRNLRHQTFLNFHFLFGLSLPLSSIYFIVHQAITLHELLRYLPVSFLLWGFLTMCDGKDVLWGIEVSRYVFAQLA
jgi:hypothetical protein